MTPTSDRKSLWAYALLVLVLSFFTYVWNYGSPASFFWDENYHVASAQKYLEGVFFMEPHPPLGKLFIALGEKITHANIATNQFTGTDYAKDAHDGMSFWGYRLFPVLFAWFTAPLLFALFLLLLKRPLHAALLTFPYIFDTALIVHSRAAMLDSTMTFFCVATLYCALAIRARQGSHKQLMLLSALYGIAFACAMATKVLALIMTLTLPFVLWSLWPHRKRIVTMIVSSCIAGVVVYLSIWQIHFSLARTVNPVLPDDGYYQSSDLGASYLNNGTSASPLHLPVMLWDAWGFLSHYSKGVPELNLCKSDENGSPWFLWPIGARAINYRWETAGTEAHRTLTIIGNPAVWWGVLLAVFVALALLLGKLLLDVREKLPDLPALLLLLGLYGAYMAAVSQLSRVMYVYHYFLPLLIGMVLLGLLLGSLPRLGKLALTETRRTWLLLAYAVVVFLCFQIFRPFAYYLPLTDAQVQARSWNPLWELHCATCGRNSTYATPLVPDAQ